MTEIFPDNTRIDIFSADYLIYGLITLLVENPDDR